MKPRAVLPLALASALLACSRTSPRGEPIGTRAWIDTVPRASTSSSGPATPPSTDLGALVPPSAARWSEAPPIDAPALGCRARVIAPWLRLACDERGGAPDSMVVTNVVEHLFPHRVIERRDGELATTLPYDVDVPLEIVVSSRAERRARAITFRWTAGASRPPSVEVGAPEPAIGARFCACVGAGDASSCDETTKLDCERAYANDCAALMDCARGREDASGALVHPARCLPGYAPRKGGACVRP